MISLNIPGLAQARHDHHSFVEALRLKINGQAEKPVNAAALTQYAHGLGPWLYAHAMVAYAEIDQLRDIEELHAGIHKLAAQINLLISEQKNNEAKAVYEQVVALDKELTRKLDEILQLPALHQEVLNVTPETLKIDRRALFEAIIENAPVAMMVMTGPDHIISIANERMIEMLGKDASILGKPASVAVPEIAVQPYLDILTSVLKTKESYKAKGMPGYLTKDGVTTNHYFDFTYKPLLDANGDAYGIMAISVDVTETVEAELAAKRSAAALWESEVNSQIKTSVLEYCELIIGISHLEPMPEPLYNNQYTLDRLGWKHNKGRTLIDAVYPEDRDFVLKVLPEIYARKGGSYEIRLWNEVTKEPFWVQWNVMVIDDPSTGLPAILATVSPDITERKQQQILMQQQQQSLLDAIEVAQLGTWSMDIATQKATFSQRHLSMFGVTARDMDLETAINHVVESERAQLVNAFFDALKPGSDGKFEAEYTIIHGKTGKAHIIHTKGQTNYDPSGKAVSISGIAQDVTMLRTQQQSLEALVELRTKELDASNKKLAEGNQRLQQANLLLRRSNEDLNRFAYVASHDLQEPLRKIQQFGSRLMAEFETTSPKGQDYLSRMSAAAGRMSSLINDLLTFSRVSTSDSPAGRASLKHIVEQVITDLEVQISQADATFEIGPLPDVPGNTTHLTQLFQNLVSNAIKFRKVDPDGNFIPPTVKIHSQRIAHEELPEAQQSLAADMHYYRIDISDDGIGFDTVYLDRIFQVFQRLHGRSEYTGTGIGLAICERIVVNMGGMITAISSPGNGSTFQIYLPDSQ
ncbi:ATP-binding protein [Dyadobacter sp. Leaf189]|uniref:ATP-binding protein n=1 Tax=Dyadobacter sp. Leaf189 TaxID=1736295 RepID=UPI0012FA9340|nr:ATP-binding protein [Dyadobacter sp. Leaf189]